MLKGTVRIYEVKNKGVDQLRVDLCPCFCILKSRLSHDAAHNPFQCARITLR